MVGDPSDAEVGQPDLAVLKEHVGRFEVAVHDPGRVRGGETVADLSGQLACFTGCQPTAVPVLVGGQVPAGY